jgi:DNA-binding beta-propeller fold protein YncE
LGNDSVSVIDLATMALDRRITGFSEPQGVEYDTTQDILFVANGGDGTVRRFAGADLKPMGQIDLGSDADNIHLNPQTNQMVVGYGDGAIAILNGKGNAVVTEIPVGGHPEGFQIDPVGGRIFVNVTSTNRIALLNIAVQSDVAGFPLTNAAGNFPMAYHPAAEQLIVATRFPPLLLVYDSDDGVVIARLPLCADADDIQVDAARKRLYVSCGAGLLDVFAADPDGYTRIAEIPTANGARTAFYAPALDLLFVAAPAHGQDPAAILVYQPSR